MISSFRRDVAEDFALLVVTQQVVVNSYLRFLTPEDGIDILSRHVGKNYHYSLRSNPEERISQVLCFWPLKNLVQFYYRLLLVSAHSYSFRNRMA